MDGIQEANLEMLVAEPLNGLAEILCDYSDIAINALSAITDDQCFADCSARLKLYGLYEEVDTLRQIYNNTMPDLLALINGRSHDLIDHTTVKQYLLDKIESLRIHIQQPDVLSQAPLIYAPDAFTLGESIDIKGGSSLMAFFVNKENGEKWLGKVSELSVLPGMSLEDSIYASALFDMLANDIYRFFGCHSQTLAILEDQPKVDMRPGRGVDQEYFHELPEALPYLLSKWMHEFSDFEKTNLIAALSEDRHNQATLEIDVSAVVDSESESSQLVLPVEGLGRILAVGWWLDDVDCFHGRGANVGFTVCRDLDNRPEKLLAIKIDPGQAFMDFKDDDDYDRRGLNKIDFSAPIAVGSNTSITLQSCPSRVRTEFIDTLARIGSISDRVVTGLIRRPEFEWLETYFNGRLNAMTKRLMVKRDKALQAYHRHHATIHYLTTYNLEKTIRNRYLKACHTPDLLTGEVFNLADYQFNLLPESGSNNPSVDGLAQENAQSIEITSLFDACKGNTRRAIISGEAGSGKSALCRFICHRWSTKQLFRAYSVVIHIHLKKLLSMFPEGTDYDISDVVAVEFDLPISYPVKRAVSELLASQKILWILDGLDEVISIIPAYLQSLFYCLLDQPHCIIMTRPSALPHLASDVDVTFKLEPFKDAYVELAVKNTLCVQLSRSADDELIIKTTSKLMLLVRQNETVRELIKNPLTSSIICYLAGADSEIDLEYYTLTNIYCGVEFFIWRNCFKYLGIDVSEFTLEHPMMAVVQSMMAQVAYYCYANHIYTFDDEIVKKLLAKQFDDASIGQYLSALPLLTIINKQLKSQSESTHLTYTFSHAMFRDFYAAKHLVSLFKENSADFSQWINENRYNQSSIVILTFMSGLLSRDESDEQLLDKYISNWVVDTDLEHTHELDFMLAIAEESRVYRYQDQLDAARHLVAQLDRYFRDLVLDNQSVSSELDSHHAGTGSPSTSQLDHHYWLPRLFKYTYVWRHNRAFIAAMHDLKMREKSLERLSVLSYIGHSVIFVDAFKDDVVASLKSLDRAERLSALAVVGQAGRLMVDDPEIRTLMPTLLDTTDVQLLVRILAYIRPHIRALSEYHPRLISVLCDLLTYSKDASVQSHIVSLLLALEDQLNEPSYEGVLQQLEMFFYKNYRTIAVLLSASSIQMLESSYFLPRFFGGIDGTVERDQAAAIELLPYLSSSVLSDERVMDCISRCVHASRSLKTQETLTILSRINQQAFLRSALYQLHLSWLDDDLQKIALELLMKMEPTDALKQYYFSPLLNFLESSASASLKSLAANVVVSLPLSQMDAQRLGSIVGAFFDKYGQQYETYMLKLLRYGSSNTESYSRYLQSALSNKDVLKRQTAVQLSRFYLTQHSLPCCLDILSQIVQLLADRNDRLADSAASTLTLYESALLDHSSIKRELKSMLMHRRYQVEVRTLSVLRAHARLFLGDDAFFENAISAKLKTNDSVSLGLAMDMLRILGPNVFSNRKLLRLLHALAGRNDDQGKACFQAYVFPLFVHLLEQVENVDVLDLLFSEFDWGGYTFDGVSLRRTTSASSVSLFKARPSLLEHPDIQLSMRESLILFHGLGVTLRSCDHFLNHVITAPQSETHTLRLFYLDKTMVFKLDEERHATLMSLSKHRLQ